MRTRFLATFFRLLERNMTVLREPLVAPKFGKWTQLILGLICMASISSPQYVWTLLTKPLTEKLGVGLPELQVTFSLLIILQTFFSPFQGRLVERFWPASADLYRVP
ncbi:Oxalate:formate exchange protein [Kluyvera cryocrescens]|uniref:Oxalate:formate exchange protein n=1 Tax=Kluyvera cryocrescens TaxID=580 RepID=A0A485A989_KLUCR|nr:Oxalate:formate exchange protein [Kluyvera cryocrescens]